MSTRTLMTQRGAQILRQDLEAKKKRLQTVIQAVSTASDFGDRKENAEYSSATSERDLLLKAIQSIESKLLNSQIIDPTQLVNTGRVVFGTTVHLSNVKNQEQMTFQIVGEDEADVKLGKISLDSPISRALIGKMEQDIVEVKTLEGVKSFQIEKVEYI